MCAGSVVAWRPAAERGAVRQEGLSESHAPCSGGGAGNVDATGEGDEVRVVARDVRGGTTYVERRSGLVRGGLVGAVQVCSRRDVSIDEPEEERAAVVAARDLEVVRCVVVQVLSQEEGLDASGTHGEGSCLEAHVHDTCSRVDKQNGSVRLRGQEGDRHLGVGGERPFRVRRVATVAWERDGVGPSRGSGYDGEQYDNKVVALGDRI